MTDLCIIGFCCVCEKYIRETNLPFVGKPVAIDCGHVFHSSCIKNFKECPQCNEKVVNVVELNVDVSKIDQILRLDENWQELVKQKFISLELDDIENDLKRQLNEIDLKLDKQRQT